MRSHVLLVCLTSACYSGSRAATDVDAAWRGHARVELDARLGAPAAQQPRPDGTTELHWTRNGVNIELPSANGNVSVTPTSVSVYGEAKSGVVEKYKYEVASAIVDPSGHVLAFSSDVLAAGVPGGLNLRTGFIAGLHAGMGVMSDAGTPIPSGGFYVGGMIGPRLGLVGIYQFTNAKDTDGFAMAHAWGFGVQHWPAARLQIHAGPALVLDLEPGLKNAGLSPGVVGGASYAFVRAGSFVLDARLDATVSTAVATGTVGVGVNIN